MGTGSGGGESEKDPLREKLETHPPETLENCKVSEKKLIEIAEKI